MSSSLRLYRRYLTGSRFFPFNVKVKETDLWIAVNSKAYSAELQSLTETAILKIRHPLEQYLQHNPQIASALKPCLVEPDAPPLLLEMVRAGNLAGVGPMAAVAGAIAEAVGSYLLKLAEEVIVENGGDLFIKVKEPVTIGIQAGSSIFSGKLSLQVEPERTPLGICTSSGTVGPSISFGHADAAVAVAPSTALADAAATALGNLVKEESDLEKAIRFAQKIEGLTGALLLIGDRIAAWGDIRLQRA